MNVWQFPYFFSKKFHSHFNFSFTLNTNIQSPLYSLSFLLIPILISLPLLSLSLFFLSLQSEAHLMSASSFDGGDSPFWVDHRPNRNPYNLNNRIMLTAIISLSLVVLLVIALHIYARYALRRHARRQAVLRRQAALRHLGILALVDSSDLPRPPRHSGLDPLVMASLPVVVFKHQLENPAAVECAVCLCAVEDGEEARVLPNCKHTFHLECIDKWFGLHSTCPICRTEAAPMIRPEPREAPVAESGGGSSSRLSSFRRILSRERSSRRIQPCVRENGNDDVQDLERQQTSM